MRIVLNFDELLIFEVIRLITNYLFMMKYFNLEKVPIKILIDF